MMKRLFILLFILCSLQAFSQPVTTYLGTPTTSVLTRGAHRFGTFAYLPGVVAATPDSAGAIRYNAGGAQLWTGLAWIDIGASIDSFTYATRRYVDNSVSASTPTLQQVLTAGNTATLHLTTTGNITGADITGTGSGYFGGGKVVLWDGGTVGIGDFYDPSDNVHTSINYNYGGNVSTNRIELVGSMSAPVAPMTNTGFFYHRSGTPYFYYNGTETAIASGGGGASTTADLTDVSDAAPANNTVLTYNQDSAKYVPTAVARYGLTTPANWDKLRYRSSDSTFVNYATTYTPSTGAALKMLVKDTTTGQEYHTDIPTGGGSGGGVTDSLMEYGGTPSSANVWINTEINRIQYRSGGMIFTLSVQDSTIEGSGTSGTLPGYTAIVYDDKGAALSVTDGEWSAPTSGGFSTNAMGVQTTGLTGDFEIIAMLPSTLPAATDYILFAVAESAIQTPYGSMKAGFYLPPATESTEIRKVDNGSLPYLSGVNKEAGMWLKIERVAGDFKLYKSTTEGGSWTLINDITYSNSGTVYPVIDLGGTGGIVQNPQYKAL